MILVTHLWQSTLCVGFAALLAVLLRHTHARVRHTIWLLASLKFLVPFTLLVAAGQYLAEWTLPATTTRVSIVIRWLDTSLSFWNLDVATASSGYGAAFAIPRLLLFVLVAVWFAGAGALLLWRWRRWQGLSRLAQAATPLRDGRERAALERVPRNSTRPRHIELLPCASTLEPGVLGIFRPKLLWPTDLSEQLSDTELDAILTHELCHVDRRDNLSALLQMVVETVFWFYPVVWWLGARLVSERERACDEEVVRMNGNHRSYAEGILKVCAFCLRSPLACVSGVGGSDLTRRIEQIMKRSAAHPLTRSTRALLAAVGVLVFAAPLATGVLNAHRPGSAIPEATMSSHTHAQDAPRVYKRGEDITMPTLVYEVKPKYTDAAKEAGIRGTVMLQAVVLEDGTVGNVEVVRSLDTVYGLDDQAVTALEQWRFEPGTKDKKPVRVRVEIEMTFTLK
jgi:bla regulator protein BlaR1